MASGGLVVTAGLCRLLTVLRSFSAEIETGSYINHLSRSHLLSVADIRRQFARFRMHRANVAGAHSDGRQLDCGHSHAKLKPWFRTKSSVILCCWQYGPGWGVSRSLQAII